MPLVLYKVVYKLEYGATSCTTLLMAHLQKVDQLLLAKLIESTSMASTSLVSLVQLLDKVKNMIISDHIQREVSGLQVCKAGYFICYFIFFLKVEFSLLSIQEVVPD